MSDDCEERIYDLLERVATALETLVVIAGNENDELDIFSEDT